MPCNAPAALSPSSAPSRPVAIPATTIAAWAPTFNDAGNVRRCGAPFSASLEIENRDVAVVFVGMLRVGAQELHELLVRGVRGQRLVDRAAEAHVARVLVDA